MIGIRRRIAWALAPLWIAAAATAHPIVIHGGSVEWENRTLRVTLPLDEHAFEHETEALGRTLAPEQVARALVRSIHVTPHMCALIDPAQIIVREDGNIVTCDYGIPEGTTALALVHRPGTELGALSRQFQIVQHSPTAPYASTIRLTTAYHRAASRRFPTRSPHADRPGQTHPKRLRCPAIAPRRLHLPVRLRLSRP